MSNNVSVNEGVFVSNKKNQVRIIGGSFRGRKLTFPEFQGLRPTPDRIRETLFNWLQGEIAGAMCLDLFSGSGALGFEALSRGAKHVVFVDAERQAVAQIKQNAEYLQVTNADFMFTKSEVYLEKITAKPMFDVVFCDPPFHQNLLSNSLSAIAESSILKANAKVYVEAEVPLNESELPDGWFVLKAKTAGKVHYHLLTCS